MYLNIVLITSFTDLLLCVSLYHVVRQDQMKTYYNNIDGAIEGFTPEWMYC